MTCPRWSPTYLATVVTVAIGAVIGAHFAGLAADRRAELTAFKAGKAAGQCTTLEAFDRRFGDEPWMRTVEMNAALVACSDLPDPDLTAP